MFNVQSKRSQPHCKFSCAPVQFANPPYAFCWCSCLSVYLSSWLQAPRYSTAGRGDISTAWGWLPAVVWRCVLCYTAGQGTQTFRAYIWDRQLATVCLYVRLKTLLVAKIIMASVTDGGMIVTGENWHTQKESCLTFRWPCIVIYCYNKTNQTH